ncbi:formyltetrahydrofolate deformylase [Ferrimonas marina]|uniref:Formyltetrahydrofolate deformylase n=1 Tax=Ferrimonas marina TaxID=299255 RepID=A0A1M5NDU0_9GAMM|nr:formyltetrahydrofolate deformylase [Ferrimonas marina]SHG87681.1 formyltetrahydrofolate deformylase [Ferrimonas marina]
MPSPTQYVLTLHCPDRLGVMARYSGCLYEHGAFITEVNHFSDPQTERFFSRTLFDDRNMGCSFEKFVSDFETLAESLEMTFELRPLQRKPRLLIAVSKDDHCLNMLLTKWQSGVLPVEIVGVVSNHDVLRPIVEWYGIPYHHLPISADTKPEQEAQMMALFERCEADYLILARYMQILSDDLCQRLNGRAINIHHSFLPSFKGARPYHQAHQRGVKVIGATAHFVTPDLDEGPIICQEVKPVDHRDSVERMVHIGHDIEAITLADAVRLVAEQRVVLNGARTVIL